MITISPGCLLLAFIAGALLGAAYFGGLYFTVRRIGTTSAPHLVLLASFLTRLGVVLAGFYLLSPWGVLAMLVALGGFLLARLAWFRGLRVRCKPNDDGRERAEHGSAGWRKRLP